MIGIEPKSAQNGGFACRLSPTGLPRSVLTDYLRRHLWAASSEAVWLSLGGMSVPFWAMGARRW